MKNSVSGVRLPQEYQEAARKIIKQENMRMLIAQGVCAVTAALTLGYCFVHGFVPFALSTICFAIACVHSEWSLAHFRVQNRLADLLLTAVLKGGG